MFKRFIVLSLAILLSSNAFGAFTAATRLPHQYMDANGDPCSGCVLSAFDSGTTTPAIMYSDNAGTSLGTSDTLTSTGYTTSPIIWLDNSKDYKFVLKTSAAVTIWTADTIVPEGKGGTTIEGNLVISASDATARSVTVYNTNGGMQFLADATTGDFYLKQVNSSGADEEDWIFGDRSDGSLTLYQNDSPFLDADGTSVDLTGLITSAGVLSVDDTTDSSSTTTGSIHTDGGLGVVKNSFFGNKVTITQAAADAGLRVDSDGSTTNAALFVSANGLTTGSAALISSASTDTGTRNILQLINSDSAATGTTVLSVNQSSAVRAGFINQDANAEALVIDSEATTASGVSFTSPTQTTGTVLQVSGADSLTTGKVAEFTSNSAETDTRQIVLIQNDNAAATGTTGLKVIQDSTGLAADFGGDVSVTGGITAVTDITLYDTANESNPSILVGSSAAEQFKIQPVSDTGDNDVLYVNFVSTTASATADAGHMRFSVDDDLKLGIYDDGVVVFVDTVTTGVAVEVSDADALTSGTIAEFTSNSSSGTARNLVEVINDNTAATAANNIYLKQDAANSFIEFVGTSAGTTTDPLSTLTTPGALTGYIQIKINGSKFWIPYYADPS